jgi:CRP-like cAMP-binding protein
MDRIDITKKLQESQLFKEVELVYLEQLVQVMTHTTYPKGTLLFRRNDPGDSVYIILTGQIRIFTEDNQGNELTITHYSDGQVFGELSLLDQQPRSASADAATDLEVLILDREHFLSFLNEHPGIGLSMMRSLTHRVRYTTNYLEKVVNSIHWISRGDYDRAVAEVSAEASSTESQIQNLVSAFLEMVQTVREREDKLKKELLTLRIEIDEHKRRAQVEDITSTGFFERLRSQATEMRELHKTRSSGEHE